MVYYILVLKEVAITLFFLSSVPYFIYMLYMFINERNRADEKLDGIAEKILDLCSDDKPIMLNVSQERLIEKVADEIERRNSLRRES